MRCDEIRHRLDGLWEGEERVEIREHLKRCPACAQYHRDLRWVRAGFHLLQREEAPAPSLGFAERLIRRLRAKGNAPGLADFFEQVGRRFVYVALVVTSVVLLALVLPAAGPVRGLSASDIQIPTQEASLVSADPMGDSGLAEAPGLAPVPTAAPGATNEVK